MSGRANRDTSTVGARMRNPKGLIIASALVGGLVSLPAAIAQAAEGSSVHLEGAPAKTFVILLSGPYHPVVDCPDLDLQQVNVCNGSFTTTRIFPVAGLPLDDDRGHANSEKREHDRDDEPETIGNFFVGSGKAAYDLPDGTILMVFKVNNLKPVDDGQGGTYLVGDIQLDITEATGAYAPFVGGHNHMVDILHHLADGTFVEHCICIISRT
jgi:hypothetical protein